MERGGCGVEELKGKDGERRGGKKESRGVENEECG